MLALSDSLRRMQGQALELWGFGPLECRYRVIASGKRWRLREYAGGIDDKPPLLIVAAPIKRPYIWDIAPSASVVRFCLQHRFRLYLLEWMAPSDEDRDAGMADYAVRSIGQAVDSVSAAAGGARPFLMGHSLGGTFAAIFAAFDPSSLRGLIILSAPLSFAPGSSSFRDFLVAITQIPLPALGIVPGSLLSQLSAAAAPETFLWSRLADLGQSLGDPLALAMHLRVERWTLDELPLPARLVHEVLEWLYRENRFCAGSLRIEGKIIGASVPPLPDDSSRQHCRCHRPARRANPIHRPHAPRICASHRISRRGWGRSPASRSAGGASGTCRGLAKDRCVAFHKGL